jgi:hypothetical protein
MELGDAFADHIQVMLHGNTQPVPLLAYGMKAAFQNSFIKPHRSIPHRWLGDDKFGLRGIVFQFVA